jgi:uncharacterized protein
MDPEALPELVEKLRERLTPIAEVRLAVLFGSAATGKTGPGSDVDVGLLLDPYSPALRGQVEAELYRAARKPVDTVLLDDAPPLLRFEITRGVLLLEREPGHWTRFKARAWVDWWDWAPLARQYNRQVVAKLRQEAHRGPA